MAFSLCHLTAMDGLENKIARRPKLLYPFGDTVPETGDIMEVADGIFWVAMPLPFSLKRINLWLIDDGAKGWTIVDTGMPLDETKSAWRKIFEEQLAGRPVWRIIVTHMHPDHIGNAGWISRKFPKAEFWISRLEYLTCRALVADTGREAPQAGIEYCRAAGWSDAHIDTYKTRFGSFGRAVSQLPDRYFRLYDGFEFEMAGASWRVVTGNGHSPEHACLYCEALNTFISGDQILPRISSNVSVFPTEPEANPLDDWLTSCTKLKEIVASDVMVLPAHNEPFIGAKERLQHLMDGHHIALKRLSQRLNQAPRRVVDIFPSVFGRQIGDDLISMATGEAIAHLNWLLHKGEAVRTTDANGVNWYSAS